MTGTGSGPGLLLSNEDARTPPPSPGRCGRRGCGRALRTPLLLSEGRLTGGSSHHPVTRERPASHERRAGERVAGRARTQPPSASRDASAALRTPPLGSCVCVGGGAVRFLRSGDVRDTERFPRKLGKSFLPDGSSSRCHNDRPLRPSERRAGGGTRPGASPGRGAGGSAGSCGRLGSLGMVPALS